jgi:hypothetical protein
VHGLSKTENSPKHPQLRIKACCSAPGKLKVQQQDAVSVGKRKRGRRLGFCGTANPGCVFLARKKFAAKSFARLQKQKRPVSKSRLAFSFLPLLIFACAKISCGGGNSESHHPSIIQQSKGLISSRCQQCNFASDPEP